jgi:hypothetical protein
MESNGHKVLAPRSRAMLSVWLIVHFGILAASLSTGVLDWRVRDRLLEVVAPYASSLHLDLDGRAMADVTYSLVDWQHQLEYRLDSTHRWQLLDLGFVYRFGGRGRLERCLSAIGEASYREDTATAALMSQPLVPQILKQLKQQDSAALISRFDVRVVAVERAGSEEGGPSVLPPFESNRLTRWEAAFVSEPNEASDLGNSSWIVVFMEEPRLNAKGMAYQIPTESVANP